MVWTFERLKLVLMLQLVFFLFYLNDHFISFLAASPLQRTLLSPLVLFCIAKRKPFCVTAVPVQATSKNIWQLSCFCHWPGGWRSKVVWSGETGVFRCLANLRKEGCPAFNWNADGIFSNQWKDRTAAKESFVCGVKNVSTLVFVITAGTGFQSCHETKHQHWCIL